MCLLVPLPAPALVLLLWVALQLLLLLLAAPPLLPLGPVCCRFGFCRLCWRLGFWLCLRPVLLLPHQS